MDGGDVHGGVVEQGRVLHAPYWQEEMERDFDAFPGGVAFGLCVHCEFALPVEEASVFAVVEREGIVHCLARADLEGDAFVLGEV